MATASGSMRAATRNLVWYRTTWRLNVMSSFAQPMLYLLGLGLGVGTLVDANAAAEGALGGVPYVAFVAPGLLVTAAMAVGAQESMWPVMGGLKWDRSYHAMAASPLTAGDVVGGHAVWIAVRTLIGGTAVALALALFPTTRSWGLIGAVLAGVLVGLAFAMPLMAYSVASDNDGRFAAVQRFVVIPLFLFGGAFYPITLLPEPVQWIVKVFPLWHGVEIARMAFDRDLDAAAATVSVAYLMLWIVVGAAIAQRRLTARLYP
jgi:lipooligosaccharide transport system permease protein